MTVTTSKLSKEDATEFVDTLEELISPYTGIPVTDINKSLLKDQLDSYLIDWMVRCPAFKYFTPTAYLLFNGYHAEIHFNPEFENAIREAIN
jgi:hypothetical protein